MKCEWLPVTRFEQNCSVLWCESTRKAAVIDPGGDLDQIRNFLNLEDLELEVVLITHGHIDHAGGAAALAAAAGARIEGPHRGDEQLLQMLAESGVAHGVRGAQDVTPHRWLEDGDQIRFGEETLEVLHCPGHTKGHVAYFHRADRMAFVGDIMFRHSIGAWQYGGNLEQLLHSIRGKLFALGDDVCFVPGHGETSTFGHERRHNPFVSDVAYANWLSGGKPAPAEEPWPELD